MRLRETHNALKLPMFFFFFLFFCQLYPEYRGISSKNYFKDHRIANFRPLKYTAVINFQFKKVSVNKNLHYLNITKVFKYKLNIKISLDGSNPIIILLNCKVLCLKPRKVSSFYFFFTLEIQVVLGFPCGRAQLGNRTSMQPWPESLPVLLPFSQITSILSPWIFSSIQRFSFLVKIFISESFWSFNIKIISSDYSPLERVDRLFQGFG